MKLLPMSNPDLLLNKIIESMIKLLESSQLRAELGEGGKETRKFSIEKMGEAYVTLYKGYLTSRKISICEAIRAIGCIIAYLLTRNQLRPTIEYYIKHKLLSVICYSYR